MIDVVVNAKSAADQLRHARTGPKIGGKTARPRALEQPLLEAAFVFLRQGAGATGRWFGLDTRGAFVPERRFPTPHASSIHAHAVRHVHRRYPFSRAEEEDIQVGVVARGYP